MELGRPKCSNNVLQERMWMDIRRHVDRSKLAKLDLVWRAQRISRVLKCFRANVLENCYSLRFNDVVTFYLLHKMKMFSRMTSPSCITWRCRNLTLINAIKHVGEWCIVEAIRVTFWRLWDRIETLSLTILHSVIQTLVVSEEFSKEILYFCLNYIWLLI